MTPPLYIDGKPSADLYGNLWKLTLPGAGGTIELLLTKHAIIGLHHALRNPHALICAELEGLITSGADVLDFPQAAGGAQ